MSSDSGNATGAAGAAQRHEPDWVQHAIIWHVMPLGAVGAPALCPEGDPEDPASPAGRAAAEHRLRRLLPWLDHLVRLGANVLLLGPVLHSMSHGYDTVDYGRVDPRLGTNEDLLDLIAAAHERGIRVLLDGVFNHTGIAYPAFAGLAQTGPDSPEAALYDLTWPGGTAAWEPGTAPSDYRRFEGQDWLPELDHSCPAVAELVAGVMTSWCERGVDGWRLDAAYAVDPAFWQRVLPRVRAAHPDVYVFGEVIHGDYAAIVRASGMDSVTQYELWQSVWHSLAEANLYELDWTLSRGREVLESAVPVTFLGNHDTTRIASRLAPDDVAGPDALGAGSRLGHALCLLLTLPGTPAVYYGDELGWRGVKENRLGGDDAVRPELPPSPEALGADGPAVLSLHRELIALRRRLPWLHDAAYEVLHLDNRLLALELAERAETIPTDRSATGAAEGTTADQATAEPGAADRGGIAVVLSLEATEAWLPTGGRHEVLAAAPGRERPRPVRDGVVLPAEGWAVLR